MGQSDTEVFRVDTQREARNVPRAWMVSAMAHPARVFLVVELARHGRKCAGQLTTMFGADTSTVSRHLALLSRAGILIDTQEGERECSMNCRSRSLRCDATAWIAWCARRSGGIRRTCGESRKIFCVDGWGFGQLSI